MNVTIQEASRDQVTVEIDLDDGGRRSLLIHVNSKAPNAEMLYKPIKCINVRLRERGPRGGLREAPSIGYAEIDIREPIVRAT